MKWYCEMNNQEKEIVLVPTWDEHEREILREGAEPWPIKHELPKKN